MASALTKLPEPKYLKDGFGYTQETDSSVYASFAYLPKITIITPSFNQGRFLEETIRSVVSQNYPNLEFLIIDGGSKDDSVEILNTYQSFITWFVSEKDYGTFDANNKGLARMTGDYWAVVNSDDTLVDNALFEVVKLLNASEPAERPEWITAGIRIVNENNVQKAILHPKRPEPIAGYTFANCCWIYHPCTFLSKKVYTVTGKFRSTDVMDYDYWVRMERTRYFPVIIPAVLANLRFHTDCKSFNYVKILANVRDVIQGLYNEQKHELSFEQMTQYKTKIKEWDLLYLQTFIKSNIFEKKIIQAIKKLIYTALTYPEQMFKRWYWGAVKRLFTGVFNGNVFKGRFG
jgi:glycosyltransferase involved in cell wall biosynthesis